MAFKRYLTIDGAVVPFEVQKLKAGVLCGIGELLNYDTANGVLIKTVNSSAVVPEFLSEQPITVNASSVDILVSRIRNEDEFITDNMEVGTAILQAKVGTKLQIDATSVGVLNSNTNGVFELNWTDGKTPSATTPRPKVRGYFR